MKKIKDKINLERSEEELEQYDYYDDEEITKKQNVYAKAIGNFLISFSNLEASLNLMVVKAMSDRADEDGFRMAKYLSLRDKINFSNDHYSRIIYFINKKRVEISEKNKLKIIINKLSEISEFRNKVAHANWMTLNSKGYVRVKIKEGAVDGGILLESIKMTPLIINKFTRQADAMVNRIDTFVDEINQKI